MSNRIDKFEANHIYSDIRTDEFKSIHLLGEIKDDHFVIIMQSDEELTKYQLDEILNELQRTTFKKMNISLADECVIFMDVHGERSLIEVRGGAIIVKSIIKVENKEQN